MTELTSRGAQCRAPSSSGAGSLRPFISASGVQGQSHGRSGWLSRRGLLGPTGFCPASRASGTTTTFYCRRYLSHCLRRFTTASGPSLRQWGCCRRSHSSSKKIGGLLDWSEPNPEEQALQEKASWQLLDEVYEKKGQLSCVRVGYDPVSAQRKRLSFNAATCNLMQMKGRGGLRRC